MFINNDVTNFGGLPAGGSGTLAQRPAAGLLGRIYIATDTLELYRDTGTVWTTIGGPGSGTVTGTGVSGQAAFWTGTNAISGDNAFHWDNVNKRLGINTVNPGARLDIHGTGVIAQLNGTGVNNAFLAFQSAGVTQWQIGNTAAPSNFTINDTSGNQVFNLTQSGIFSFKFPTGALMSIDSVAGGDGISINPVSTNSGFLSFKSGTFRVGINSTNQFVIRTAGTDLLSVTSTGQLNVGGNFTLTNNTLQVAGNAAIGYTSAAPTGGLMVGGNVGIGLPTSNVPATNLHVYGIDGINITSGNATPGTKAKINFIPSTSTIITNSGASIQSERLSPDGADLQFYTTPTIGIAHVERMRITSDGNVQISSGTGFGLAPIQTGVNIFGGSTVSDTQSGVLTIGSHNNSVAQNVAIGVIQFYSNDASIGGAGVRANMQAISDDVLGTSYALTFGTGASATPTERMRITGGGNVGIDYTANLKLAVNGSIYQGSNTANALYEMLCNGNLYTGGITPTILTVTTTPYTIVRTATGYKCDSGASVLDLPSASGLNNLFFIINNSGGNLTVNRNGSDTILNLSGTAVTSLTISNNQRALIYMGGGTQSYLIFQA